MEARSKFARSVVVHVHGYAKDGVWMCGPDQGPPMPVEGVVRLLKHIYPDRRIVLVVCNEAGIPLRVANVSYGTRIVWSIPHFPSTQGVGCIEQMEEGKE